MIEIPNNIFFEEVLKSLEHSESVTIPMRGKSMFPLIQEGRDAVRIKKIDTPQLNKGDLVLFQVNGTYILHRYIGMVNKFYHMRGDGLINRGEFCKQEDIKAIVTDIINGNSQIISTHSFRWRFLSLLWLWVKPIALKFRLRKKFGVFVSFSFICFTTYRKIAVFSKILTKLRSQIRKKVLSYL